MIILNEKVVAMLVDAVVYNDNNDDVDRIILSGDDGNRDTDHKDDVLRHYDNKRADNDRDDDDGRDADMRYYECSRDNDDYYAEPVEEYKSFSPQQNTTQSSSSISLLSQPPPSSSILQPSSSSQQQQLQRQQEQPISSSSSSSSLTTKEERIDIDLEILLANKIFGDNNNLNRRSTRQVKKRDFDGFLDSTEHLSLKKLKENDGLFFLSSKTNSNRSSNRNKNNNHNNNTNDNDNDDDIVDNKNVKRKKSALLSSLLQQHKKNLNNTIMVTSLTTNSNINNNDNNNINNNYIVNSGNDNFDNNNNIMKTTIIKRGRGKPRKQPPIPQIQSDYDNIKIISTTSSTTNCISHLNAFVNFPITSPSRIISSSSITSTTNNNDNDSNDNDGLMKSIRKRSNLHSITPMLVKMADEKYKHEFQTIDSIAATKANITTATSLVTGVAKKNPLTTTTTTTTTSSSTSTADIDDIAMTEKLTRKGRGKGKSNGKIMSLLSSSSPQASVAIDIDDEVITEKNVSKQRRKPYITQRILNAMAITNNNKNKSNNNMVNTTSSNNYNNDNTTNNNIETIFTSFILALKNENYISSNKARNMLCSISPHLRFIMLNIISLGFYYSRSSQRVELHKKWKGILKIDKIKISANYWAINYLNLQHKKHSNDDTTSTTTNNNNDIVELIDLMGDFFLSCWNDYNKNSVNLHKKLCKVKKL
jgi:hypothetical protein